MRGKRRAIHLKGQRNDEPRYVAVHVEKVLKATPRAALLLIGGESHWIPHSQYKGNLSEGESARTVDIALWVLHAKGVDYGPTKR